MRIVEQGVDTRELFRIEISEDGYFAVRDRSPKFALFGATIEDVVRHAVDALSAAAKAPIR